MKPGEELMLLLELNGFDIKKYKLKKQLEYEKTGNMDLYKHKKYADLVVSHYQFEDNLNYLHRNPLNYKEDWGEEIKSIDQFYFNHPELDEPMTLRDFLHLEKFNAVQRESIIYDILDAWVEEYRESSITQMENLREMIKLLPKKSRKYRKPSKIAFLMMVLMALTLILIYKNPTMIQPSFLAFVTNLVNTINTLLYESAWYSLFGLFVIVVIVAYAVINNAFGRLIKDIRKEKNKRAERTFDKWENDMKSVRLKQSGILEDYVDKVIQNPNKSELLLTELRGPELLMDKFKAYVQMIERRYDRMTKYYKKYMFYLRLLFLLSFLLFFTFFGVGYAIFRGWIGV